MINIDLWLDHPLLRETLREAPELTVEWVRTTRVEGSLAMLFWAPMGDSDQLTAALEADPTVSPDRAVDIGGQRLYQVKLANRGAETSLYPTLVELDGTVFSAIRSVDGWQCQLGFPSQHNVDQFLQSVEASEIEFEVKGLYAFRQVGESADFGLTDSQRETLLEALDSGHFEVPRRMTTKELAEVLGISDVATSQRLRRGIKTLLKNTVKTSPQSRHERSRYTRTQ